MAIISRIVETAAIAAGLFCKAGSADNGAEKSGAGEVSLGISKGSNPTESIAVGDHVSIAADAEITKVELAATMSQGADVTADANAKAVAVVPTDDRVFRGGTLMEGGVPGDQVDCLVKNDYVSTVTIT